MISWLWWSVFVMIDVDGLSSNKIYRIKEETEIGYVIDYIKSNDQNNLKIFNINDNGVSCFDLESSTGKFYITRKVDREEICPTNRLVKSNSQQCEIVIKLAHQNVNFVQRFSIIIEDINDNPPIWTTDKTIVTFNENSQIGTRRSLPEATDLDVGSNGQIIYRMESKYRNSFRLFQDNGLYIENTQMLDREKKHVYEIIIIAQDNGSPYKSNELQVTVEIVDMNDNAPKFTDSIFRPEKQVLENSPPGTVILLLKAVDHDSGSNGEFTYRISPNTSPDVERHFTVRPTGEVEIKTNIDYDSGQRHFEFKVIVQDHAVDPYALSSEAVVEIDIQDINDEYPKIIFYPRNPDSATRNPTILENSPTMTQIGQISVSDLDFKGLDKVSCESYFPDNDKLNPIIAITTNEQNEFNIVSNRKFDRETESVLHAEIRCSDAADHTSKINLTIIVIDINDNPPEFNKGTYHFYIKENQQIGTIVDSKLTVSDKDSGNNGKFSLLIESPGDNFFTIDQQNHLLKSKMIFDREQTSIYKLKVLAIDNGAIRLTSSCIVYVHIRDINDNPVVIASLFHNFHISENKQRTQLGTIKASDLDNNTIFFLIDSKSQMKFSIEKLSGKLYLQNSLDREEQDTHYITVTASDGTYTASTTVTVYVDDENDNKPIFTSPTNVNKILKIDTSESPGFKICKIIAVDLDLGNNGVVKYTLKKSTHKEQLFNLDNESGDLHLAVSLHTVRLDASTYLDIEACDQGQPPQCTILSGLEIQWTTNRNEPTSKESEKLKRFNIDNFINENVLIAAISGLLVLMIIIMIAFIIFKQKSIFFARMPSRTSVSNTKKHINPSITCYRDTMLTPDYHCSTELDNLEADMRQNRDMGTTPIFHCSNLCITDSKDKTSTSHIFIESTSRSMSPLVENQMNIKDFSRKSIVNPDNNYYCKYFTDHSSNITISESPTQIAEFNNIPKNKNKKHQSSFV